MAGQKDQYRKTYMLIVAFIALVTISFVMAVYLARNMVVNNVEGEFVGRKVEIVENAIAPYNRFFGNSIPEISFYQGYLDSAAIAMYTDSLIHIYPFIKRVVFYDLQLSNDEEIAHGFKAKKLSIFPKGVYEFEKSGEKVMRQRKDHFTLALSDDFNSIAVKLGAFIEQVDTTKALDADDLYRVFYTVNPGKVSYVNIPRMEDIRTYKKMQQGEYNPRVSYEQDALVYYIDGMYLTVENTLPALYQKVAIRPLLYETLDSNPDLMITESPLPGALADYKIYFSSSRTFLIAEIERRLFPVISIISGIYLMLLAIAYLIYRNLNINKRMFKLQYDFINNLTHEFKTPVSVIKIAGNNIVQAKQLSDNERKLYGRILDEEADKLNNLMNTLLSFTQIENKSIKMKYEDIDLHEFCSKIITASRIKYPDMEISSEVNTDKLLYSDSVLLGSVFQNMIDNACKYSRSDSKFLKIRVDEVKGSMVFKFSDRGIGIARQELPHIFKKFYRVQNQYNQQGSVGIGLAFCKELVNFMGGTIAVQSEVGQGTIFTITLPMEA